MRFKKLKIKNIRSYKDQEICFPEGSLLLSGDIGSGKTSVLIALEYSLFGLQPGQKGSSLLRNKEDIGEVVLEMEAGGKEVVIERKLKRSSKGVANDYASITIDNNKKESSLTEVKSIIVNLLGYPQEFVKKNNILYRYTVYSQQEQIKQIILEDTETRLNILRHIFGIEKYKRIRENVSILLTNLKTELKIMQARIKTIEEDKENLKSKRASLILLEEKTKEKESELQEKTKKSQYSEFELKDLERKLEEKKNLEREIEKAKILVSAKKDALYSVSKQIIELEKTILDEKDQFKEEEYSELSNKLNLRKKKLEESASSYMELNSRINSLEKERNETLEKKERIFSIDICPTCLQDVSETYKHNILNESESKLSRTKEELSSLGVNILEIKNQTEQIKKEISYLENNRIKLEILKSRIEFLEKSKIKLQTFISEREELEKDIIFLQKHSSDLKESVLKYSLTETLFNKKLSEVKQALLDEKNLEISLAGYRKEIELSIKDINALEDSINKKEEIKNKLNEINEIIEWFSSLFMNLIEFTERNILLKLRNEFSNLFRKWFLLLVPENAFDSRIDENFTPIIIQGGAEIDYDFLSGGERTAVALAYRLALNQIINSILSKIETKGVIILDEPTDGFSETQIMKIRDILEELNVEQLIMVSHEQKIESFVDHVIRITKEEDTSIVEGAHQVYLAVKAS
ncbi:MAG: AAA family ATPase [Nanoarchaeota archaeon]